MKIVYTPSFLRQYDKLSSELQKDVQEKITLFRADPTAPPLHSHKLKGQLKKYYSFRVNYRYRITFEYDAANTVALLQIGDHDIYQ